MSCGLPTDLDKLHFSFLAHFKDDPEQWPYRSPAPQYSMADYLSKCVENERSVTVVKLAATGEVSEHVVHPFNGKYNFGTLINDGAFQPSIFSSLRKLKSAKENTLSVYHYPMSDKNTANNTTASNLFKLQLFGDVIIVQLQKAGGMPPRDQFLNFTTTEYNELFTKKRRRATSAEVTALTTEEYQSMKKAMESSLNGYEEQISAGVAAPSEMGAVMPAPTGKELAAVATLMGNAPPPLKRQCLEARLCEQSSPLVSAQA